jgi:hypothetical protein
MRAASARISALVSSWLAPVKLIKTLCHLAQDRLWAERPADKRELPPSSKVVLLQPIAERILDSGALVHHENCW